MGKIRRITSFDKFLGNRANELTKESPSEDDTKSYVPNRAEALVSPATESTPQSGVGMNTFYLSPKGRSFTALFR